MAANSPVRWRLPRQRRLQQNRDFMRVRAQGQRLACGCLIANWMSLPEGSLSRLGVVTGRKLGGAIVRSRARRLLRETFRLHQHDLRQPVNLVLVARPSIVNKHLPDVERDFLTALHRAGMLKASK